MQTPIEVVQLTQSCLKMKNKVKKNEMSQDDMDREVTKKVFGAAGSIGGGFGVGIAGMVIGTLIFPGVGTAIGGAVGGFIGSVAGRHGGTLSGSGLYKIGKIIKEKKNERK